MSDIRILISGLKKFAEYLENFYFYGGKKHTIELKISGYIDTICTLSVLRLCARLYTYLRTGFLFELDNLFELFLMPFVAQTIYADIFANTDIINSPDYNLYIRDGLNEAEICKNICFCTAGIMLLINAIDSCLEFNLCSPNFYITEALFIANGFLYRAAQKDIEKLSEERKKRK